MRLGVLGGGPAGLYFSILLKKLAPEHEVHVYERNAPDATFGWGIVFSEETLGALREADYVTSLEIAERFTRWQAIDVSIGGETLRAHGHGFSAISRVGLLELLQRRAQSLGVELSFGDERNDLEWAVDHDVVVAADGANSGVRAARAAAFQPQIEPYASRYVWYGIDRAFDAFTFVFRETEHGMFQLHGYPFAADRSTAVIECSEETWLRAGLEDAGEEETRAYCSELFRSELGEYRLLSNRSVWLQFSCVRTARWHDGNVVLLGDAAHTAHFSIGSGTKLAMESAVALAESLAHADDLSAAFTTYELTRRPVVERFQEAARQSALYFENVARYRGLARRQFAFNLLTRSGRIGYGNLSARDPSFVEPLDAWFHGRDRSDAVAPPPAFSPLQVGRRTLPNRIVRAVESAAALAAAAGGGAGLVLAGTAAVEPDGRVTTDDCGLWEDTQIEHWHRAVETVHAHGGLAGIRLGHAGARGATRSRCVGADLPLPAPDAWPLVAASAHRYTPLSALPRAATGDDLARIREAFAAAAGRAVDAGFDVVELHAGHGFLLASFLSPLTNHRDDRYGGCLEARLRFPLEVLAAVRSAVPEERMLAVRFNACDWARGGIDEDEAAAVARALAAGGADLLVPVAGQTVARGAPAYGPGYLTGFSDLVRSAAGVPTIGCGYLTTLDEAHTAVGAGRADLCQLERRNGWNPR